MQKVSDKLRHSASDLVNFSACAHLTHLDLFNLDSPLPKAEDTEEMVLVQQKGFAHEARYWEHLKAEHGRVVDLSDAGPTDEHRYAATRQALASGADVVFQATLLSGPWVGHADFLVRVAIPSQLGNFSYEITDTKLARSSRAKFLLQLCLYSDMLAEVQGVMPKHMHVVLGDGRQETFLVDYYLRYFRRLRARYLDWVGAAERQTYPQKVERCGQCRWRELCAGQWEKDDHLNRVANIARTQIDKLQTSGIGSMRALAQFPLGQSVPRIQPETLDRLRHQAKLQISSAESGQPVYELLPLREGKGFSRLPRPDSGDLFFDMEGDPMAEGGLEYLFGLYFFEEGKAVFKPLWAHSRQQERLAFEVFIDFVTAHLRRFPRAYVYHYAPYETTALKRLMSLHGTRESELDDLLRQGKLVDLYAVVRESIRVGESSYSIKAIERFYSSKAREGDVKTAGASVVFYEKWKATADPTILQAIADYNLDDVRSTFELRQWLLVIRPADAPWAAPLAAGKATDAESRKSEMAVKTALELEDYRRQLLGGLPDDRFDWMQEQRVREMLFHLLQFHRRADKPAWWALFARREASEEDLHNDLEALAGLTQSRDSQKLGDATRYWYRFPEQETKLRTGDSCTITSTMEEVSNVFINEDKLEVSFESEADDLLPANGIALGSGLPINSAVIVGAIRRFVDAYLAENLKFNAGMALLRRELPCVAGIPSGSALLHESESLLVGTLRVVSQLDESYLFIQGPPGAGKTFTGSHVIVDLLKAGKTVGVTSNSHKAINNLLEGVEKVAAKQGFSFRGAKKSTSDASFLNGQFIEDITTSQAITRKLTDYQLVAGTAWLFSSKSVEQKFDYLFVDEAGQVSLANLVAMSTCAKNLVLLGDQMQLGQPIQGVHPGESGQSTLDYLLQGEATISPERGVFLKDTWRMHPDVCRFISEAVYGGRLEPEPRNAAQLLLLSSDSHEELRATGVRFLPVEHEGCSQRCDVEAQVIRAIFGDLLRQRYVDRQGGEHQMGLQNILVVAPYNQQVNWLTRALPEGARVGTVDKFQGQEAEVVLVSMTTSSGQYLPRDLEFLYSKNRLNVAISRARCLAIVVANPKLLEVECAKPEQMALVNTLCWVRDYSCEFGLEKKELRMSTEVVNMAFTREADDTKTFFLPNCRLKKGYEIGRRDHDKEKGIQSYWDALAKLQAMSQPRFRRPNKNGIPGTVTCEPGDSEDVSKAYILQQLAEAEEGADEGLA